MYCEPREPCEPCEPCKAETLRARAAFKPAPYHRSPSFRSPDSPTRSLQVPGSHGSCRLAHWPRKRAFRVLGSDFDTA